MVYRLGREEGLVVGQSCGAAHRRRRSQVARTLTRARSSRSSRTSATATSPPTSGSGWRRLAVKQKPPPDAARTQGRREQRAKLYLTYPKRLVREPLIYQLEPRRSTWSSTSAAPASPRRSASSRIELDGDAERRSRRPSRGCASRASPSSRSRRTSSNDAGRHRAIERWSRQIILPEVGGRGQERLLRDGGGHRHGGAARFAATSLAAPGSRSCMAASRRTSVARLLRRSSTAIDARGTSGARDARRPFVAASPCGTRRRASRWSAGRASTARRPRPAARRPRAPAARPLAARRARRRRGAARAARACRRRDACSARPRARRPSRRATLDGRRAAPPARASRVG